MKLNIDKNKTIKLNNEYDIMTINEEGIITFSDEIKNKNNNEIASAVLDIIENAYNTKILKIKKIINTDKFEDTKLIKFANERDRDFVKARLFEQICDIMKR